MLQNGLIRKLRVVSTFKTSPTEKEITTIHIMANISRRRVNQIMKFGQLIEYNMIIFFS